MEFVMRSRPGCFEPNADVLIDEERGQVVVSLELAGADPESLAVALDDDRALSIVGRRPERARLAHGSLVQKEIAYGEFAKRIQLPVAVERQDAAASFADGILTIVFPIAATRYFQTARTQLRVLVTRIHP